MAFWTGLIVAGVFAWFLIKRGFFESWVMLFNVVIAIYLGIFSRPLTANLFPSATQNPYGPALNILAITLGVFLILYGIAFVFFTSQFRVPFPRLFDTITSAAIGFLAGFLVWGFVVLLIAITPLSRNALAREMGLTNNIDQGSISYLCWWCEIVNTAVARSDNKISCEQAVEQLFDQDKRKGTRKDFDTRGQSLADPAEQQTTEHDPLDEEADTNISP